LKLYYTLYTINLTGQFTKQIIFYHLGTIYRKGGSEMAKLGHVDFKGTSHILLAGADKNYEKSEL
jgi:hypothetical protein